MIVLVAHAPRHQIAAGHHEKFAVPILRLQLDSLGSFGNAVLSRTGQTALHILLLASGAEDFRIDAFNNALAEIHNKHPAEHPHLRRRQSDAVRLVQRLGHVV